MALTQKRRDFVNAYVGPANFSVGEAAKIAGYSDRSEGYKALKDPEVQELVKEATTFAQETTWLSQNKILEKLWEEAHKEGQGCTQAARIQALVHLGKHIGMWQEKTEEREAQITYNIINYNSNADDPEVTDSQIKQAIEDKREEVEAAAQLPSDIVITDYNSDEDTE